MKHGRHICSRAYANNVKCTYSSVPGSWFLTGHTVDCNRFIWGIYIDILVLYLTMNYFAYVAYMWYLKHIFGNKIWSTSYILLHFGLVCTVMWGLHVDPSSIAVWHICAISQAHLLRGICQYCEIYVYLCTLLIALSSYEVYILTKLSHVHMNLYVICDILGAN